MRFALKSLFLIALATVPSYGQSYQRFEAGTQVTMLRTISGTSGCGGCSVARWAIGPEVAVNLNRYFAADGVINFFPRASQGSSEYYGGQLTQVLTGLKATIRDSRFAFFAKARPGLVSWSNAVTAVQVAPPGSIPSFRLLMGRKNFFALNFSGGIEYSLTPRIGMSVELGETIIRRTNLTGKVQFTHEVQSSAGIDYRFGRSTEIERAITGSPHRFFDPANIGLIAASFLAQAADGIATQRTQANCRRTNATPNDPLLGCAQAEGNPIARPFVTHGWGGQIALAGIVNSAQLAVMYGMHRMGYHRVERVPPIAMAAGSSVGAYSNLHK